MVKFRVTGFSEGGDDWPPLCMPPRFAPDGELSGHREHETLGEPRKSVTGSLSDTVQYYPQSHNLPWILQMMNAIWSEDRGISILNAEYRMRPAKKKTYNMLYCTSLVTSMFKMDSVRNIICSMKTSIQFTSMTNNYRIVRAALLQRYFPDKFPVLVNAKLYARI
jgi:hypothetical protein